jgi:DNA transposition AAA+ family ATPase
MAPELLITMEANELRELGQKIREWQQAKALSDAELCRKFGELGSTKTFKKILDNQLEELDLERQLNNYRTAWALMEGDSADEREEAGLEKDLYATVVLNRVFLETRREKGLARAIFLIGPSGSGKTSAQDYLREQHGPRIISIRAVVAWNDSPNAMMAAILTRLGVKDAPAIQGERFNRTVEKLKETRRALFIEDSHHLGPRCLALIVALIDETPGEFLLAAVDSLWAKIQTRAYQEIEQLRVNRLAEKITLGREVREKDVQKLIERRVQWEDAAPAIRKVLPLLCEKAHNYGRLAFVREVIKRANDKAGSDAMTPETFAASIAEEVASR